jgi:hypothetical protein
LLFLLSLSNEIASVGRPETGQKISFNTFDSYETAFEGLSRKALNLKAREAKKVAKTYRSVWEGYQQLRNTMLLLRRSPGVQLLIQLGSIRKESVLNSASPISRSLPAFVEDPLKARLSMSLNLTCQVWSNFQRQLSPRLGRSKGPT